MKTFKSDGFRTVKAATIDEAGEIFAARAARRAYGRRGYVRTIRRESWVPSGQWAAFRAFAGVDRVEFFDHRGRPSGQPSCVGRDVYLEVSAA